ncbi:nucleotide disphospho-sugar-binding domain-containing protein [Flavitalea flava]
MSRFVFIVPPFAGHVNPTLSLGAELIGRGHEVGWISLDAALKDQLPSGGRLLLVRYEQDDHGIEEGRKNQHGKNEHFLTILKERNVIGIESIKFLYEEVLIPLSRYMAPGIETWLEKFKPDLVINDHQLFAGAIAAFKRNIPYATSVTAPAALKIMEELPRVHEWEVNKIKSIQYELGIQGDQSIICSSLLTLVFTSRLFFGEMSLPACYQFAGPVIGHRSFASTFDWSAFHAMGNRPKVLVSIGTTFDPVNKKTFFARVREALGNEPVSVIVVTDPSLFEEWPENFLVREKIPQIELLPYLDGVVCHGGHNTVSEALMHGLPIVVIPIAYDQSHVAGRVAQSGSGIRLNFSRFRSTQLNEAIKEILFKDQYRSAARRIQLSFEEAGGAVKAAELLERAVQPVKPFQPETACCNDHFKF